MPPAAGRRSFTVVESWWPFSGPTASPAEVDLLVTALKLPWAPITCP
ncbi:hypothetical protein [Kribbella sp. NPDC051770]